MKRVFVMMLSTLFLFTSLHPAYAIGSNGANTDRGVFSLTTSGAAKINLAEAQIAKAIRLLGMLGLAPSPISVGFATHQTTTGLWDWWSRTYNPGTTLGTPATGLLAKGVQNGQVVGDCIAWQRNTYNGVTGFFDLKEQTCGNGKLFIGQTFYEGLSNNGVYVQALYLHMIDPYFLPQSPPTNIQADTTGREAFLALIDSTTTELQTNSPEEIALIATFTTGPAYNNQDGINGILETLAIARSVVSNGVEVNAEDVNIENADNSTGIPPGTIPTPNEDGIPIVFTINPLTQNGEIVLASWTWSGTPIFPLVNCGTDAQTLSDTTGHCQYTQAGTFIITGTFIQDGSPATITNQVVIPSLTPMGATLTIASVDGQAPSLVSGVYQTGMPTHYPVPVTLTLTLQRPAGIGILETLNLTGSSLAAASLSSTSQQAADWSTFPSPTTLPLTSTGSTASLTAFQALSDDASHWLQRIHLQGVTAQGTPLGADVLLQGPMGTGAGISLTMKRIDPAYPWAPGIVSYRLATLSSTIQGEPLTPTWTVTQAGNPVPFLQSSVWTHVPIPSAGTYAVQAAVSGPLSGTSIWTDTITLQAPPAANTPSLTCIPPTFNRPPATYRCTVINPQRLAGERLTANPTWSVDGSPAGITSRLLYTFTSPGSHTIQATIPTSYGRTFFGTTTITVNPNQPPVATIDCSRSWLDRVTNRRHLYCKAIASDPDGRVKGLQWNILETTQIRFGSTVHFAYDTSQILTVQLTVTDDSGSQTVVQGTVNLGALL